MDQELYEDLWLRCFYLPIGNVRCLPLFGEQDCQAQANKGAEKYKIGNFRRHSSHEQMRHKYESSK